MNNDLQKELDIKKWIESEQAKKDLCSTYDYCQNCDKTKENPCALAYSKYNKVKKPILSFSEKLAISKEITKEKYCTICNEILSKNIKMRVCKKNVTLRHNKVLLGLITLTKNSLKIHLALDPTLFEEIPHLDYSEKKTYADCPFTIKLSSKRALKNAMILLQEIKK